MSEFSSFEWVFKFRVSFQILSELSNFEWVLKFWISFLSLIWLKFWNFEALIWAESGVNLIIPLGPEMHWVCDVGAVYGHWTSFVWVFEGSDAQSEKKIVWMDQSYRLHYLFNGHIALSYIARYMWLYS